MKELLWRLVQDPEDREEEGLKRLLGESVREPIRVAPDLEVNQLLQLYSKEHEHIALVMDDDRLVGMVTLEDVIEELIGEVDDEYDQSPRIIDKIGPGLWRFGGGTLWSRRRGRVATAAGGGPSPAGGHRPRRPLRRQRPCRGSNFAVSSAPGGVFAIEKLALQGDTNAAR